MKGSGTVRRGGLVSKFRMSFVFSAGSHEEKRQSETGKREKQKGSSKILTLRHSSILQSPSYGMTTHSEQVYVAREKEKNNKKILT